MSNAVLTSAQYGKDKVHVFHVVREDKWHTVVEYNITALFEGAVDVSYTQADNSVVIATDLIKNITYYLAKFSPHILTPKHFTLHLGTHLVSKYAHIHKAFVTVEQLQWTRIPVNSEAHKHTFYCNSNDKRIVNAEIDATAGKDKLIRKVTSGISDLLVLKTTSSGFSNFICNKYTTLAKVNDCILSTSVDLSYTFNPMPLPTPTDPKKLMFVLLEIIAEDGVWDGAGVAERARKVMLELFAMDESASV